MNKLIIIIILLFSFNVEAVRKSTDGFENGELGQAWSSVGTPLIESTIKRSGSYSAEMSGLISGTRESVSTNTGGGNSSAEYFRIYIYWVTFPSAENRFIGIGSTSSTHGVYATIDNGGLIRFYSEDGAIGSASTAQATATWIRYEIFYSKADVDGAEDAEFQINGVSLASSGTQTIALNPVTATVGANLASEANTTGEWYVDDGAVNDGTGAVHNSWVGDGSIINLKPNAAGDSTQWTPSAGNNWDTVDESPNNDADFVSSSTLDQIDEYEFSNTPSAITAGSTIRLVVIGMRHRDNSGGNLRFTLRIKSVTGGTVEESAALNPSGAFAWLSENSEMVLYDLPGASTTVWTKATLDTLQAGFKLSADDTTNMDVSNLLVKVEYTTSTRHLMNVVKNDTPNFNEYINVTNTNSNIETWEHIKWDGTNWSVNETQVFNKKKTKLGIALALISTAFDAWFTQKALSKNGVELNPLTDFMFKKPVIGWSFMLGTSAFAMWNHWDKRESKPIWFSVIGHTAMGSWNAINYLRR